ncbi:hypothetical protein PG985_007770 [Apiospora marii]|uniref:Uncharacterized protein n=1 Tax=Apiospora marii TaxID=335849 RepID=A0ABR1SQ55_9PEZI
MGWFDVFWRALGYNTRQAEECVKIRTKTVDDGWTHLSVPKKIPDFEEQWVDIPRTKKAICGRCQKVHNDTICTGA